MAGSDPFGPLLDEVFASRSIRDRAVVVLRLENLDRHSADCHVVFVGLSGVEQDIAMTAHGHYGALTIGEGQSFIDDGGMIAFITTKRKVGFAVSDERAKSAGLRISSRLLSLAENLRDVEPGGQTH